MTGIVIGRGSLSRAAVVGTAADFADLHGIDELTLTRVAQELGVSLPALYNHVRSHSDCVAALALVGLDELTARLRTATGDAVRDEAVRALAAAWREYAAERPGRYAAIHRQRWNLSSEQVAASGRLLDLLTCVVLGYEGAAADGAARAWALGAALHGFVAGEAEGASPVGIDRDPAFACLVELLCAGLRATATPALTTS